jgi:RNA polymerase sigma factor (sigma-70 family)
MATSQLRQVIHTLGGAPLHHEEAHPSDGQLLESYVRSREEAAFAALVSRHGPMVWGVCRRLLRCHQDAEDAFQATFLVLVRKAASVVPRALVANWLYGVAHQTALKARATSARRTAREKQVPAMPEPALEQHQRSDDLQFLLDQELSRLPDKYRAVIVLCDLEGKTRKEAARHFHLPEGTIASRLATARAMLAKRLARHGCGVSGAALAAVLAQGMASAALPASVAASTIRAASLFAAGRAAAAGVIPVKAVALAEGVLRTMLLTKLKIATALLVAVAVLGWGTAALTQKVLAGKPADQKAKEKQTLPGKLAGQPGKETKESAPKPTTVNGVVQAVDAEKNTLTVVDRDGATTFNVAKDAKIDIDGKRGRLAGLPVGANVTLSQFTDARTVGSIQAGGRSYFGARLKAVDTAKKTFTIEDKQGDRTFSVAQDACLSADGKPCTLAGLSAGAFVNVGLAADQTTARSIGAEGPCLGGCGGSMVKAVDAEKGTFTFDDKAMAEVAGKTFTVAKDAFIQIDGGPGKFAEVPAGAYVSVVLSVDQQRVIRLQAQGPSNICDCGGSMVTAVDAEKGTLTFDDKARAEVAGKTFNVRKTANIVIDGGPGKLSEVPPGSYVNLWLSVDRQWVTQVFAHGPAIHGNSVKAVDAEKNTVTIDDKTYPVARNANILVGNKSGRLADLPVGAKVSHLRLCVDQKTLGTIFVTTK